MMRKDFTEDQSIGVLREDEAGVTRLARAASTR